MNTSKVHINTMFIIYTFVHFAILLIRQVFGVVPLLVTISFAVEALSFRLGSSFGLLHGSGNLLAYLLEVPFLSLALLLETSGLVNHQHLMLFLISTFVDFRITKSSGIVTLPFQSYTNHTCKRVRSRSGTHGKISQH